MIEKSPNAFRTISEVSEALDVPAHVLRFWESKFNQIKPVKRGGGRRYYRPTDLDLIRGIRDLLYSDGLTIKGVQKVLREKGVRHVMSLGEIEGVQNTSAPVKQTAKPARKPAPEKSPVIVPQDEPEQLFELSENQAPAPRKPVTKPAQEANVHALKPVPAPEPDIRSLFDDPLPTAAETQAIMEDEVITKVAKIAEGERETSVQETSPAPRQDPVAVSEPSPGRGSDKKSEIKRVLGRLESLRDRMDNR